MEWQSIASAAQEDLLRSLPQKWRINKALYSSLKDVTGVPLECGILSNRQIEITELTVSEIAQRIRTRALTAVEVLEAFAARAAIAHQLVNCLADWFFDEGLQQAQKLDEILDNGGQPVGPLHGVPVALKDTYSVKGHPTTWGYIIHRYKPFVPEQNSAVVETLQASGAVFYCRTTMPQTGMLLETVSNLWGRTLNPYNRDFGAGGSSGGDGALVAMKGAPIAPSSDIGGSIRVPAAFNGLYGIRPTSLRIPKGDWESTKTGQISIRDSAGPVCHSIEDIRLFTQTISTHPMNRYDVSAVPLPWRSVGLRKKLSFGLMKWDGVVMPHPPILRAMEHTKRVLIEAGHEVMEFETPFNSWELAQTAFSIYFQDAAEPTLAKVAASGEPLMPAFAELLKVYNGQSLQASEILELNLKIRQNKTDFANAWQRTRLRTSTRRPIDALICPVAPSAGIPHDFNVYWGYTSMFNVLDYPSIVMPVPNFQITPETDPINLSYTPVDSNPYDKANHDLYNPSLFSNQPTSLQIVARPFDDEELIEICASIDESLKCGRGNVPMVGRYSTRL